MTPARNPRRHGFSAKPRAVLAALLAFCPPALADGLPAGWVRLYDVAPGIAQDMRYARAYNFTGASVPGYDAAECILRDAAAQALIRVDAALRRQGLALIIWDCYRPARATAHFADWAETRGGPDLSGFFFPDLSRGDLIAQGYVARHSSHSTGATVDLGLMHAGDPVLRPEAPGDGRCDAPFASRPAETTLDMGTAFDCFSPLSGQDAALPAEARANRRRLSQAMQAEGFIGYAAEWWHFRLPLPETAPQDFPLD